MICPDCNGTGFLVALVDGVRDGKRRGWHQKIPCDPCKGTGIVTDEVHAASLENRRARTVAHMERMAARLNRK